MWMLRAIRVRLRRNRQASGKLGTRTIGEPGLHASVALERLKGSAGWVAARRVWYRALERRPSLFVSYLGRRHPDVPLARRASDVVLDGFQGSGSTFLRQAFLSVNPGVVVATHAHSPAHLRRGVELGCPTALLVRDPVPALASWISRIDAADDLRYWMREYARLHEGLQDVLHAILVVPFDAAVHRPGDVIVSLNQRYGTRFRRFPHEDPDAIRTVEAGMRRWADLSLGDGADRQLPLPSEARRTASDAVRALVLDPAHARGLARCRIAYDRIMAAAAL